VSSIVRPRHANRASLSYTQSVHAARVGAGRATPLGRGDGIPLLDLAPTLVGRSRGRTTQAHPPGRERPKPTRKRSEPRKTLKPAGSGAAPGSAKARSYQSDQPPSIHSIEADKDHAHRRTLPTANTAMSHHRLHPHLNRKRHPSPGRTTQAHPPGRNATGRWNSAVSLTKPTSRRVGCSAWFGSSDTEPTANLYQSARSTRPAVPQATQTYH